ncbi:MAG: DHHA1 domain-containing protein [Candidatus Nanoarchaeia archaeon]
MQDEIIKAHTGEHILFQSLSRFFKGIELEKIDITENKKSLFVKYDRSFDRRNIVEAELLANKIIEEGRCVNRFVGSMDEIKKKFGSKIRGKWERIDNNRVSVIEIEGFDYAACSGEHVKNTRDVGMILIKKIRSLGKNKYEIQFEVNEKARRMAIELKNVVMGISSILGAQEENLEKSATNLKKEFLITRKMLKIATRNCIQNIEIEKINGINFYHKLFFCLDNDEIGKKIGEIVKEKNNVVFIANKILEDASVFLGRSNGLDFNALQILREVCNDYNGKCGGNDRFATGNIKYFDKEIFQKIKNKLVSLFFKTPI